MAELNVGDFVVTRVRHSDNANFLTSEVTKEIFKDRNAVSGRAEFISGGTYTFVVPTGVINISALVIGGGGGGAQTWAQAAGSGGGLAWADNIEVSAGDTITVTVGAEANPNSNGNSSSFGSYFSATGGQNNGNSSSTVGKPVSGTVTVTAGTNGGEGGWVYGSWQGGGGGAGGYTGNGGNGWYGGSGPNGGQANGLGGAGGGGGGYASSTYAFAGGGGVGIRGEDGGGQLGTSVDPNQQSSPFNSGNQFYSDYRYSGPGGSGGEHGGPPSNGTTTNPISGRTQYSGEGGRYGGGGGGAGTSLSSNSNFGKGAVGAVCVVWSTDPNFSIGDKH